MNAPSCTSCASPLPWEDVDRGAGRCARCGTTFDFAAAAANAALVVHAHEGGPALRPLREIALPAARTVQPSAVRVVTGETLEIRWKRGTSMEVALLGMGVVTGLGSIVQLSAGRRGVGLLLFALSAVALFAAIRSWLSSGVVITMTAREVHADEMRELQRSKVAIPLAHVSRFCTQVLEQRRAYFEPMSSA